MELLVETEANQTQNMLVTFVRCPVCRSVFQLAFNIPAYEGYSESDNAIKFYVEQGAGLETLVLPALIAAKLRAAAPLEYLEVGCGFGFGLDFARHALGWRVGGMDPSPIAVSGRDLLNLPIESRYLGRREPDDASTYDVIAAMEVLEHLADPHSFLSLLKSHLAPDGLLIMSTPDAGYIELGVEKPGLLSVLTPGYHAVLFSEQSLLATLKRAGFADVRVEVRGATLLAVAGPGASTVPAEAAFDASVYRHYLESRSEAFPPTSPLGVGLKYRLYKSLVNSGMYGESNPVFASLAEAIKIRDGLDLRSPHSILARLDQTSDPEAFVAEWPACITGLLFFTAMVRLNHYQDRESALTYFYAAYKASGCARRAFEHQGVDDGETADLQRSARRHMELVLGWMA